jgi:hypothetical protein
MLLLTRQKLLEKLLPWRILARGRSLKMSQSHKRHIFFGTLVDKVSLIASMIFNSVFGKKNCLELLFE